MLQYCFPSLLLQLIRKETKTNLQIMQKKYTELLQKGCCKKEKEKERCCIANISFAGTIYRLRKWFWNKKEEEQNQFILDFLECQKYLKYVSYSIDNETVCLEAWRFCYAIGKTR